MDKQKITIILDAGHGWNTLGKQSPDGQIKEWKYARDIVNAIELQLRSEGYKTFLSHPEDKELLSQTYDLSLRTERANDLHRKLTAKGETSVFVSVHLNASGAGKAWMSPHGYVVYVSNHASTKSKFLAQTIYEEAEKRNLQGNRWVPDCKYWQKDYYVLRRTNMPAVLTENLFMDNREDAQYLLSEQGKQSIVDIHVDAIKKYIQSI